ncbi:acyltransferase [Devosia sp. A16]|uniref:acyltransferase n=1 Tax=Devosia sp. A16 TaxID=1736675 RepID=UPI0006D82814|nr:acyltransferase [Devosia sp. A16]
MTSSASRNASLDALRVLSLFGIVTLHVAGGGFADNKPLGFVVDELSRFAVPVFFLMSAYFWKDADLAAPLRLAGKVARRVMPAFAVVLAITVALRLLEGDRPGFELTPDGLLLLLWSGGPAFHLWFLPALVLGSAIVATLIKFTGLRWTLAIALVLYGVGTTIGAYSKPLLGHGFPFWMDRNGLFFAPVFLVAGIVLRRNRTALAGLPVPAIVASLVLFAALHLSEGYFVVGRYALGHDYSLATLGYALSVAVLFMRLELKSPIWSTLGQATFGAYLIHLLVLQVLAGDLGLGRHSLLMIGLGFSISLGLAVAWRAGRPKLVRAPVKA